MLELLVFVACTFLLLLFVGVSVIIAKLADIAQKQRMISLAITVVCYKIDTLHVRVSQLLTEEEQAEFDRYLETSVNPPAKSFR